MKKAKKEQVLQYAMLGLVCLLLLVSGVQAVQIHKIKGDTTTASVEAPRTAATSNVPSPAPVPAMVGGC